MFPGQIKYYFITLCYKFTKWFEYKFTIFLVRATSHAIINDNVKL